MFITETFNRHMYQYVQCYIIISLISSQYQVKDFVP